MYIPLPITTKVVFEEHFQTHHLCGNKREIVNYYHLYNLLHCIDSLPRPEQFNQPQTTKYGHTPLTKLGMYRRTRIHRKHDRRGAKSILDHYCVTSASQLQPKVSMKMGVIIYYIKVMDYLQLLDVEYFPDKKNWYKKLDITNKGYKFMKMYETLLDMIHFFYIPHNDLIPK